MSKVVVKKAGKKGKGLFATKDFRKGEFILRVDLTKLKEHKCKECKNTPDDEAHIDYVGRGKYIITYHPYSYINHSCNPNVIVKHETIARSSFFAMNNIKKGEELTYDYGVNAMDQFDELDWIFLCKCGSKQCRKKVHCNFFKQTIAVQKRYFKYLPSSIKRKYRKKFEKVQNRKA